MNSSSVYAAADAAVRSLLIDVWSIKFRLCRNRSLTTKSERDDVSSHT